MRTQSNVHKAVKEFKSLIKEGYTFKEAVTRREDVRFAIEYLHKHTLVAFTTLAEGNPRISHDQTQTLFAM